MSVQTKFIPYKWEYPGGVGAVQTTGYPTWSIIDPEDTPPSIALPGSFYSYGNCSDTKPYIEHHRIMRNYTDLGLSKQDTLIQLTNGSASGRATYSNPATISTLARAPNNANEAPIGLMVFTIHYEFSGQRSPSVAVSLPKPMPPAPSQESVKAFLSEPQSESDELTEQEKAFLNRLRMNQ